MKQLVGPEVYLKRLQLERPNTLTESGRGVDLEIKMNLKPKLQQPKKTRLNITVDASVSMYDKKANRQWFTFTATYEVIWWRKEGFRKDLREEVENRQFLDDVLKQSKLAVWGVLRSHVMMFLGECGLKPAHIPPIGGE